MWQPQKDGGHTPPVRCFRAWAARLALVTGIHVTHFQTPVSGRNKVQPFAPPCSHPSQLCFASCPGPHLQAGSQAMEPGALHQPVHARTTLPEWAAKNQQMGCLTQNFKDLSPLPSVPYFYTACSTQLAEHSLLLPSLTLVNKAMRATEKERERTVTPQLIFSSPGPFSSEPTGEASPDTKAKYQWPPFAACTHRSPSKQCQGQAVALAPQVPGHQHTHTGKRKLLSGPSNTKQLCLGRAATAHPCWGLSSSCAPETFCFGLCSRSNE